LFTEANSFGRVSTRDPNHQNYGFWVPGTLFLKKGHCPKSGLSDRISDTPYILP